MRVGDQHGSLAGVARAVEKLDNVAVYRDQVVDFLLEPGDVQPEFATPVFHAIPFHGALLVAESGIQPGLCRIQFQTVGLGIARWHEFPPEVIVEMQVEQGAVHIEKHAVDFVPWDHNLCNMRCAASHVSRVSTGRVLPAERGQVSLWCTKRLSALAFAAKH